MAMTDKDDFEAIEDIRCSTLTVCIVDDVGKIVRGEKWTCGKS